MKSPFPGMDPYLERHWGDVHISLITYIRDELQPNLPDGLFARGQEAVRFEETLPDGSKAEIPLQPDVKIVYRGTPSPRSTGSDSTGALVVDPPPIIISAQPLTERWIEIIDYKANRRVVTAIEILSPSNKRSGYDDYRVRRNRYLSGQVNLVEIDLLRGGRRNLAANLEQLHGSELTPYFVCVTRPPIHQSEVYPLSLRKPLQNIGIPLRAEDKDVVLPLQRVIDKVYELGQYAYDIDYTEPLNPPLSESDQQWAREILDASHS